MDSKAWKITTFIVALVAVVVGVFAYSQHSEVTALTTQLAATTADAKQAHDSASNLSAQLVAATKDAGQAHSEAAATEAKATAEQQQLQTTEAQLASEARRDLPINLGFRKGLLSPGLVGVFRSTSSKILQFTLDVESPATGQHVRRAYTLNPNSFLEIGAQQGWVFAPGQHVTLNNPAYRPRSYTVGG